MIKTVVIFILSITCSKMFTVFAIILPEVKLVIPRKQPAVRLLPPGVGITA